MINTCQYKAHRTVVTLRAGSDTMFWVGYYELYRGLIPAGSVLQLPLNAIIGYCFSYYLAITKAP